MRSGSALSRIPGIAGLTLVRIDMRRPDALEQGSVGTRSSAQVGHEHPKKSHCMIAHYDSPLASGMDLRTNGP